MDGGRTTGEEFKIYAAFCVVWLAMKEPLFAVCHPMVVAQARHNCMNHTRYAPSKLAWAPAEPSCTHSDLALPGNTSQSAAQHLLPMCDIYTAGIVFDALCPKRMDVPDNAGEHPCSCPHSNPRETHFLATHCRAVSSLFRVTHAVHTHDTWAQFQIYMSWGCRAT